MRSPWDTRDDESAGWPDDAPQSWRTTAPRGPMIAGTGQRWLRFGDGLLTAPPPVTGVDDSGAWSYVAAGPLNETLPAADGGLWTLEGNGVYKRAADGSIAASTGVEAGVLSLAAGGDDLLIAAIDDAYRWRPGRFFGALTALGLKAPVASVREARDGAVWAGLMSKDRVARVDAETGDIHYFGDDVRGRVDGLAEDDAGGIWAATTAGAWRIEPKDGTIRRWTRATGLLGDEQTEVFVKGSAVWFRGPAGVSAWDPKLSAWVHTEKSLPTPLGATASGPIVVTHEGAAAWMDGAWVGQASSPFPITALAWEAGAAAEDAWDFLLSTGDVLSGNGAGETTLSSPPLFPVAAIARSHGRVCVGGAGLACRTQGAAWVNVSPGLAEGESVTALVMTPQAAWVGTSAGRLCREGSPCFDAGVGSVAALSLGPEGTLFAAGTAGIAAITAGAPIELFDGPTTSLAYDPITGVLWAGTPTGLLRVAPDGTIADLGGGVPRDPTGWGGCAVPGHLPGELLPGRIDALAMDGRGRLYVRQGEALYDLDARASSANLIPPAPASSPSWR